MEKKSNKVYTVIRIIVAIVFIPNAFIAFFVPPNQMGLNADALKVLENLWESGYIMPTVKVIELIAGIMFLTNKYVKLACILIMPIIINIVLLGLFKEPKALMISIPLLLMIIYLIRENWRTYKLLLLDIEQKA
jgi:putative oxidoreductase